MTDSGSSLVARFLKAVGIVCLPCVLFTVWYSIASNYGYRAVSGTHTYKRRVESATLVLNKDQSFREELTRSGKTQHTAGTWHLFGQSGIEFSRQFQALSGEGLGPQGEFYGQVVKRFGLLTSIILDPQPAGPTFHKKLLSR
jgi:hypothetical protein